MIFDAVVGLNLSNNITKTHPISTLHRKCNITYFASLSFFCPSVYINNTLQGNIGIHIIQLIYRQLRMKILPYFTLFDKKIKMHMSCHRVINYRNEYLCPVIPLKEPLTSGYTSVDQSIIF